MKGQKRGTCKTCTGAIHFYPQLDEVGEPLLDDGGRVVGAWAHLDPDDWVTNPHSIDPEEPAA